MLSFANLAPDKQEFFLGAMRKLGDPMVIDDTAELLAFMDRGEPVRLGADTGDVSPAVEILSIGARPYEYPSR